MSGDVKCPNPDCGHIFDPSKTFWWGLDKDGDPTVENITCPKCGDGTRPAEGGTFYGFDRFVEVEE